MIKAQGEEARPDCHEEFLAAVQRPSPIHLSISCALTPRAFLKAPSGNSGGDGSFGVLLSRCFAWREVGCGFAPNRDGATPSCILHSAQ
jgi:hypothetical protein